MFVQDTTFGLHDKMSFRSSCLSQRSSRWPTSASVRSLFTYDGRFCHSPLTMGLGRAEMSALGSTKEQRYISYVYTPYIPQFSVDRNIKHLSHCTGFLPCLIFLPILITTRIYVPNKTNLPRGTKRRRKILSCDPDKWILKTEYEYRHGRKNIKSPQAPPSLCSLLEFSIASRKLGVLRICSACNHRRRKIVEKPTPFQRFLQPRCVIASKALDRYPIPAVSPPAHIKSEHILLHFDPSPSFFGSWPAVALSGFAFNALKRSLSPSLNFSQGVRFSLLLSSR